MHSKMLIFHALNFMDAHNSKQNKSLDIHCIQWNLRTMDVVGRGLLSIIGKLSLALLEGTIPF